MIDIPSQANMQHTIFAESSVTGSLIAYLLTNKPGEVEEEKEEEAAGGGGGDEGDEGDENKPAGKPVEEKHVYNPEAPDINL